jgi:hypothetical protein
LGVLFGFAQRLEISNRAAVIAQMPLIFDPGPSLLRQGREVLDMRD